LGSPEWKFQVVYAGAIFGGPSFKKAETYVVYNVNENPPGIAIIGGFYLSIHMICKIYSCNVLYRVLLHLILGALLYLGLQSYSII